MQPAPPAVSHVLTGERIFASRSGFEKNQTMVAPPFFLRIKSSLLPPIDLVLKQNTGIPRVLEKINKKYDDFFNVL